RRAAVVLVAVDRHVRHATGVDPAAVHAVGVERDRDVAVRVQRDRTAVAAQRGNLLVDDDGGSALDRHAHLAHLHTDRMRGHGADVVLAPAGAGHRAIAVRVGARADDRRVADAAPALVGHATGRGAGGKIALRIQRHRTHGAEVLRGLLVLVGLAGTVLLERLLQLLPAFFGAEVRGVDQRHADALRERLGALAGEHHVRRLLHHRTREQYRVPDPLDAGHRAGTARVAVHD